MLKHLSHQLSIAVILEAFPSRNWVSVAEVRDALFPGESLGSVGCRLGRAGLVRTQVRVGGSTPRVWLIRGEPQDFSPVDVRAELIAHGFPAPEMCRFGPGKGTLVRLTKLAHESPSPR